MKKVFKLMKKYSRKAGYEIKLIMFDNGSGQIRPSSGRGYVADFNSTEDLKEVLKRLIKSIQFPVNK